MTNQTDPSATHNQSGAAGEEDTEMENQTSSFQTSSSTVPDAPSGLVGIAQPVPPPMPKKDRTLREFLGMMEEYAPIVTPPPPPCHFMTIKLTEEWY